MASVQDPFNTLREFHFAGGTGRLYSLPALEKAGLGKVSRLPRSIRVVLESVLRNLDGLRIREEDVRTLARWAAKDVSHRQAHGACARPRGPCVSRTFLAS